MITWGAWKIPRPSAYEIVDGPGINCSTLWVAIQAYTYGDYNIYSNYGREDYEYNVPYYQLTYAWTLIYHHQSPIQTLRRKTT